MSSMNGQNSTPTGDETGLPFASGSQAAVDYTPRGRIYCLAQMLVDAGIMGSEQVAAAQEAAWRERQPLSRVLVRDSLVLSRDLATLIALNLGLAMVDLRSEAIEREAIIQVPEEVARKYMVLPVSKQGNCLTVAMTDPTDLRLLQD